MSASTAPQPVRPVRPLRIGNASGFYGDRFAAFEEMLGGGPLDVVTGDYLAELTMLILARDRLKDPQAGYAKGFLRQLEGCLGLAADRGVRIVVNAGGLNPARLAEAVEKLAGRLGVATRVGYVTGDDLLGRAAEFTEPAQLLAANAYLGAFGIADCLRSGADVVVTGRVTDAALVVGPGVAHFDWQRTDFDALAGAVVAGHVLECGAQATGGNYAWFTELADPARPGFPLAELHADGSSVITKHPGTGGAVTVDTVTAQLLYETGGPRYLGPDVTARLDTVQLAQQGPDRVRISGVRGEAPPATLKVGLNRLAGWRNEVVFVLTGLDIEQKAELVQRQVEAGLGPDGPAEVRWTLARTDQPDAPTEQQAGALLQLTVRDSDQAKVGRSVSSAAVELGLASYPGFHLTALPGPGTPYGVFTAAYVEQGSVEHWAVRPDGGRELIPPAPVTAGEEPELPLHQAQYEPHGPTRRAPLGLLAAARSGDKGGDANLGVWVRSDPAWHWLATTLTTEQLRELLPETEKLTIHRHLLPNLRAVNFVIEGLLGEGVAAQARFDPQAKALGEWLRSRYLDIPEALLPSLLASSETAL
ncbi:exopolyphosphatase [Streptomyces tateyamensis]|uniref:Exopolyphosphatase n=1 Tax=Streptomyces tateyamensis TaxID=565073 RepID=A0A2V4P1U9_9ACTN|nr:acyclic terpene utilization AtuA family protein [Streptomyces tateyamensis]PYC76674.1 exopolyphosphatase [Streptomyces tateyamensis]